MKTILAMIAIAACAVGCGSSAHTDDTPVKPPVTDADGKEKLPSGTVIQRSENGDK
ncbi:MAG: hypothetical protein H7Y17_14250 [Chlorobia bacterium]|nr:hypothetical protein [Fimbriimonadaceae bacterium]